MSGKNAVAPSSVFVGYGQDKAEKSIGTAERR